MPGPHSFANRSFLIGGLILFASGLYFIASRHHMFTPKVYVYTEFDRLNGFEGEPRFVFPAWTPGK